MKDEKNGWVDPAVARRLMLEYRQALKIKGASEIERQIKTHTRLGLHRKTIENWLRSPDSVTSSQTLKVAFQFMRTLHFQELVPRTREYLDSDARLSRIAAALFDLYGASEEDLSVLIEKNQNLAGWWYCPPIPTSFFSKPNYLYIAPVSDRPFSKVHILLDCHHALPGSGIAYPKDELGLWKLSAHIWTKASNLKHAMHFEKKLTFIPADEELHVLYLPNRQGENVPQPETSHVIAKFQHIKESDVSTALQDLFDQWSQNVIPRNGNIAHVP